MAHQWTDLPPGTREDAQGETAAYDGHLSQARAWTHRAIASVGPPRANELVAGYKVESAR